MNLKKSSIINFYFLFIQIFIFRKILENYFYTDLLK